jgi:hypothetical protein
MTMTLAGSGWDNLSDMLVGVCYCQVRGSDIRETVVRLGCGGA